MQSEDAKCSWYKSVTNNANGEQLLELEKTTTAVALFTDHYNVVYRSLHRSTRTTLKFAYLASVVDRALKVILAVAETVQAGRKLYFSLHVLTKLLRDQTVTGDMPKVIASNIYSAT